MAEYGIPFICWLAAAGSMAWLEYAGRVFREGGFDRG